MSKYRNNLPQLSGDLFLTDGGLETTLVFHQGIDLPEFAAFDLLRSQAGLSTLRTYFQTYINIALKHQVGFILESVTWRANPDWGQKIGLSAADLKSINQESIRMLEELRGEFETEKSKMVISGCIGPRDDGYNPSRFMTSKEAGDYHREQLETFNESNVDLVTPMTMTYLEEALGITTMAKSLGLPVVVSFTVEKDGTLPSGQSLKEAIGQIDETTGGYPAYYMINCAHPTHFENMLTGSEPWMERIRGLRANASSLSHEELDQADELDDGNPQEFAQQYRTLREKRKSINILGGCCGTDHRHVEEIIKANS